MGPTGSVDCLRGKLICCQVSAEGIFLAFMVKHASPALEPGLATKAIYVLGLMAAVTGNLPNVLAGLLIAV